MEYRDMSLLIFSVEISCWEMDCALLQAEKCNMFPRVPMLVRTGEVETAKYKWMIVGNDCGQSGRIILSVKGTID